MNDLYLTDNQKILMQFVLFKDIPKEYKLPVFVKAFGYIYCIENKKNGMKYIGSTFSRNGEYMFTRIRKRASQYIFAYNNLKKDEAKGELLGPVRPIMKAMLKEGIENFVMYPLAETVEEQHYYSEAYFIKKFDTIDHGYNYISPAGNIIKAKVRKREGTPHTEAEKKKRSTEVICISPSTKKIIFADSMKLFGDYMNSSKDMIKNSVRKCRPYKGWYCFYTDYEKRNHIIETNVLGDGLPVGHRHSKESAEISVEFHNEITEYLKNKDSKIFQEYSIEELRYNV